MKIAYLLNTYPAPSGTFIRNEIEALEELGLDIDRMAVRRFAGPLVDPADMRESSVTSYLLDGNKAGLSLAALREVLTNPVGIVRALPVWWTLLRNAGGGFVRHLAYFMEAAFLRQEAKRRGITHIHSHFSNNAPAVAMLAHRMGGPGFSFTAHGPDEFVDARHLSFPTKMAEADFVVAISGYCRNMLLDLAGDRRDEANVHVARCGLDLARFDVAPPIAASNQTLVCVGRLCPQKGQVHIPAAVAALRKTFPKIRVILVGDGDSRAEIEAEIAKHGVGQQVILHGWATNDEVRRMIAAGRALLLPSYAEGLPIVIMEAFALGRPVISTTIAGIPELVDPHCGWLVPPGNHDELVAAMQAALAASPGVIERMGRKGRARVERLHDRRRLSRELRDLFQAADRSA
ncbi:glycosyltransferase family 4 protein [Paracoccus denitrificans]|uniref:glycosyltransferase family 4 protein n=1 Tax=Paracoccus denitrificans TaxID=266 RepID=UPI000CEC031C|nr:glycosyltransferase family 4 protein [Paracoccus denitrificans]